MAPAASQPVLLITKVFAPREKFLTSYAACSRSSVFACRAANIADKHMRPFSVTNLYFILAFLLEFDLIK
jgi:hypothetical protein